MTLRSFFDLGPTIAGMEHKDDPFVLQRAECYLLQCAADAGLRLPTTPQELERCTGIQEHDAETFSDLLTIFSTFKQHCAEFLTSLFPTGSTLATDVITYAHKATMFYTELGTIIEAYQYASAEDKQHKPLQRLQRLLRSLSENVPQYIERISTLCTQYTRFLSVIEQDEFVFVPLYGKYLLRYRPEIGHLADVYEELEKLTRELVQAHRNYVRSHARTFQQAEAYVWLPLLKISVPLSIMCAGEHALQWRDSIQTNQQKIASASQQERQAERLLHCLEQAALCLRMFRTDILEAITTMNRLRTYWQTLNDLISELHTTLEQEPETLCNHICSKDIEILIAAWKQVEEKAERYCKVAHIELVPLEAMQFSWSAGPSIA
uniref:Uncharacterized protein n=1 Tax=Thermosporothrix sp. COM3 TaxID=2490863 RepID=A0A455SJZ7_9CHLR|nr:hypothetical protein KTC_28170 [Thermosporothrix sp. COM3]